MEYYDYPESRIELFKPCDRNYFFRSEKCTYLCSFEEMLDVDKRGQFDDTFVLVVYKRYAAIHNGTIVYKNTECSDGHPACGRYGENGFVIIMEQPRRYDIQSWKNDRISYLMSYEIRDDSGFDKALNPRIYKNAESAVSDAVKISELSGESCIVAQWFDEYDRHTGLYSGLYDKYRSKE